MILICSCKETDPNESSKCLVLVKGFWQLQGDPHKSSLCDIQEMNLGRKVKHDWFYPSEGFGLYPLKFSGFVGIKWF